MAAGFSGALQLTDLDDFITPSQVSTMLVQHVLRIWTNRNINLMTGVHQASEGGEKARPG